MDKEVVMEAESIEELNRIIESLPEGAMLEITIQKQEKSNV